MICICAEGSHQKGMGHVFRALNLAAALRACGLSSFFAINDDRNTINLISSSGIPFEVADLCDENSRWEAKLARRKGVRVWINDRLHTSARHAANLKEQNIALATFDDLGDGARSADLHVAALPGVFQQNELAGGKILSGIDYLVLNPEILHYRRERRHLKKIVVTLGGSDTYGTTVALTRVLKQFGRAATLILGPNFRHRRELDSVLDNRFTVKEAVPSLIRELANHDLAVTGGGITPFEANALGLPCIIVSNELHEIANARYLESLGCSFYLGHHDSLGQALFPSGLDLRTMSMQCLARIPASGAEKIAGEIKKLYG